MNIYEVVLIVALSAFVRSEDSCPPHSKGKHPDCICDNKKPYDSVNRICAITIEFKEECPRGSEGVYPHCVCTQGKVYDAINDLCVESDRSVCPKGANKINGKCVCENDVNGYEYALDEVFWTCRPWYLQTTSTTTTTTTPRSTTYIPRCPYHQSGEYPNCRWDPCPAGYVGGFWPNCTTCGAHQIGIPPNCKWVVCPEGWRTKTGYYPDCYAPPSCAELGNCPITCPPYTHFVNNKCEKIPCRAGTIGDFEPNCKLLPKCPPEYPGIWPNCNIYLAKVSTTTQGATTTSKTTQKTTEKTTARTTEKPTTKTTTSTTTTTRRTTTAAPACSCECRSDEFIIFSDGEKFKPSRGKFKYLPPN